MRDEAKAEIVRSRAYALRAHAATFGSAGQIENDHNASLPGTLEYEGRTLAFSFETAGRTLRITVEDITLDEEEEEEEEEEDRDPDVSDIGIYGAGSS